jgi:hypothetical protein
MCEAWVHGGDRELVYKGSRGLLSGRISKVTLEYRPSFSLTPLFLVYDLIQHVSI